MTSAFFRTPAITNYKNPTTAWKEESSTSGTFEATSIEKILQTAHLRGQLTAIFAAARDEYFEDGMDSEFSRDLVDFVSRYGLSAVKVLREFISDLTLSSETVYEALRWIGKINDVATRNERLRLLEESLRSPVASLRDGAVLGLAWMDDPQVMRSVQQALLKETNWLVQKSMHHLLEQLKKTASEATPA